MVWVERKAAAHRHTLATVAAHLRGRLEQHKVLLGISQDEVGRSSQVLLFLDDAVRRYLLADVGGLVAGELCQRRLAAAAAG